MLPESLVPDETLTSRALDLLDRVLQASPATADPEAMKELRKWVYGYQGKFGPDRSACPPSPMLLAQLLAIASVDQIRQMFLELMAEREPADWRQSWHLVTVLKRIHGIEWVKDRKAMRKNLLLLQGGKQQPIGKSLMVDPPRPAA